MRKNILFALVSVLTFLSHAQGNSVAPASVQNTQTVYGPKSFASGKVYNDTFKANSNVDGVISLTNGSGKDLHTVSCSGSTIQKVTCAIENLAKILEVSLLRVKSVEITINNQIVVAHNSIDPASSKVQFAIRTKMGTPVNAVVNSLKLDVKGSALASVVIEIKAQTQTVNQLPIARISVNPALGVAPLIVNFSGILSSDSDGSIASYAWNFGDVSSGVSNTATGAMPIHTYAVAGNYTVTLVVKDNQGASASIAQVVKVALNKPPVASFTATPESGSTPLLVALNATASSDPDGTVDSYVWDFGDGSSGSGVQVSHTFNQGGNFIVRLYVRDDKGATSSTTKSISVITANPPVAKITLKSAATGIAPLTALFDASASSDPQALPLTYSWDFGDGSSSAQANSVAHEFVASGSYTVIVTVTNSVGLSGHASVSLTVTDAVVPTMPQAPALATSMVTPFSDATKFLYTGANAIQTGVQDNAIDEKRIAVLRGKVLDQNGDPLGGVQVSVVGSPEFGQTLTRADGQFDIATNGGGLVTINYSRNGYLSIQRSSKTIFQDYFILPDVNMLRPDPKVTVVSLGTSTPQVIQGTPQTDASGTRTATVVLPSLTTASLIMPSGQTVPVSQLSMRATEYTVGDKGPSRMPAALPATSSYTYAINLSSDEQRALGAKHIQFSKPVSFYVDNFLGFNPGIIVPLGEYNTDRGTWEPRANGRVIKVLSVTNGIASLDVSGKGQSAQAAELSLLNINQEELGQIGKLYVAGNSFWRMQMDHFSDVDGNFITQNDDNFGPNGGSPGDPNGSQHLCPMSGSIIDVVGQTLGEEIPLVGVPFTLFYSTSRVPGRISERTLNIPLTNDTPSSALKDITIQVQVAGQTYSKNFAPQANLLPAYTWDGKDAFGRELSSAQMATVKIQFNFIDDYLSTDDPISFSSPAFGFMNPNFFDTSVQQRSPNMVESVYKLPIGTRSAQDEVSGWLVSVHHTYDPNTKILYYGNGTKKRAEANHTRVSTIAGLAAHSGFGGDGGPATQAQLNEPALPFVASDGSIYFSDERNARIRKISPDGIISTFVGTGVDGFNGDGHLAADTQIGGTGMTAMAESPDHSIYFSDQDNHRIRKVGADGIVSTIAGTGEDGYEGDEGLATQAKISAVEMMAVSGDALYLADPGNDTVRAITSDGKIHLIAGTGVSGVSGDGGPANRAQLGYPVGLVVSKSGDIYIADGDAARIRKINRSGIITAYAGNGTIGYSGDGGPALNAQFKFPSTLALGDDGSLYVADYDDHRIRVISPDQTIHTFAGTGSDQSAYHNFGDEGDATAASFANIRGIALTQDGSLIVADAEQHNVIRKISPIFPSLANDVFRIPSDDGSEIYIFDKNGTHLSTLNGLTGATRWKFNYDSSARLIAVVDGDGNTTQIVRDGSGQPSAIVSPYGQVTTLGQDSLGHLSFLQNPNNEKYQMRYLDNGLISDLTKPNGTTSSFVYDSLGQLMKDQNAAGGFTAIVAQLNGSVKNVMASSALGRDRYYYYNKSINGFEASSVYDGAGILTSVVTEGIKTTTAGRGNDTTVSTTQSDQRLGLPASFVNSSQLNVGGSGLIQSVSRTQTVQASTTQDPFAFTSIDQYSVNGNIKTVAYNGQNKSVAVTSPMGRVSQSVIDLQGRVLQNQSGTLTAVNYSYDVKGRLTQVQQGARVSKMTYDSLGQIATTTDALERTTAFSYDGASRVTGMQFQDGRQSGISYDLNGNVASITPPGRSPHRFISSVIDLLSEYIPPIAGGTSGSTKYFYNLDNQLTRVTLPDGQNISYNYDSATPRLASISASSGLYSYAYNAVNQVGSIGSPDGITTSFGYLGSLVTQVQTSVPIGSSLSLTYNSDLRVTSSNVNGITLGYVYDKDQLLLGVGPMTIQRDIQNGFVTATGLGSIGQSLSYNSFGDVVADQTSSLYSAIYDRDSLGRLNSKSETINGVTSTYFYSYDSVGRLVAVKKNNVPFSSYSYDSNSNRVSSTTGGATQNATFDAQDRQLTYGSNTYTYGVNGDLTSRTDPTGTTAYSYDVFGNLRQSSVSGKVIQYLVDGQNRRVGKIINGALVQSLTYESQTQIAAEKDKNGIMARFGYGTKSNVPDFMIKNGVTYKIVTDQVGSVKLVVEASTGQIAQQIDYDEFGKVLSDSNPGFQPFGFAGGLYDQDTKLVRFGARDYDAETGRWTAKDPILFNGRQTNLYGYVNNDPINFTDPSGKIFGLDDVTVAIVGSGLVGGAINAIGAYNQPGANFTSVASAFGTGFVTGAGAITVAVLTGGIPAAGAVGTTLTGSGAFAGILADLGLTALFNIPSGNVSGLANGISAVTNGGTCPPK